MQDSDRIEKLEWLIERLIDANRKAPVVVEGKQDEACLRQLGLKGNILKIHVGRPLSEFSLDLSQRFDKIILLTDWDARGDQIHERLVRDLEADWAIYDVFRQGLRDLCDPDVREVEHVEGFLRRLKANQEEVVPEEDGPNHAG